MHVCVCVCVHLWKTNTKCQAAITINYWNIEMQMQSEFPLSTKAVEVFISSPKRRCRLRLRLQLHYQKVTVHFFFAFHTHTHTSKNNNNAHSCCVPRANIGYGWGAAINWLKIKQNSLNVAWQWHITTWTAAGTAYLPFYLFITFYGIYMFKVLKQAHLGLAAPTFHYLSYLHAYW